MLEVHEREHAMRITEDDLGDVSRFVAMAADKKISLDAAEEEHRRRFYVQDMSLLYV